MHMLYFNSLFPIPLSSLFIKTPFPFFPSLIFFLKKIPFPFFPWPSHFLCFFSYQKKFFFLLTTDPSFCSLFALGVSQMRKTMQYLNLCDLFYLK